MRSTAFELDFRFRSVCTGRREGGKEGRRGCRGCRVYSIYRAGSDTVYTVIYGDKVYIIMILILLMLYTRTSRVRVDITSAVILD